MVVLVSFSAAETLEVGRQLGRAARAGDVILLEGPLGAGKTVLVQGIAEGLETTEAAGSPTFVLVRQYQGRLPLVHADLYRVGLRAEVEALGLLELAHDGVLVVEWADRAPWLVIEGAAILRIKSGDAPEQRHIIPIGGAEHLLMAMGRPA